MPAGSSKPKSRKHAARVFHRPGAIGRGLVPDRRQPEHRPRITGAQRAHDHVVECRGVLDGDDVLALTPGIAEFGDRRRRVLDAAARDRRDRPRRARRRVRRCAGRPWSHRSRSEDRARPDRHSPSRSGWFRARAPAIRSRTVPNGRGRDDDRDHGRSCAKDRRNSGDVEMRHAVQCLEFLAIGRGGQRSQSRICIEA